MFLSLPAGTEMFQFPAFAPRLEARCRDRSRRVSPFGHPRVWRAFAPNRGFSQLVTSFFASESHRHPPCALSCFLFSFSPSEPGPARLRLCRALRASSVVVARFSLFASSADP